MKNVLIIDYHFPPLQSIAANRFGRMTRYMPQYDWQPLVLTTASKGPTRHFLPEKQIFRIGTHPQETAFVDEDQETRQSLGLIEPAYGAAKLLGLKLRSVDKKLFTWGRKVWDCRQQLLQEFSAVDVVLGTYPPVASLWLSLFFARRLNVPWIADFRDLCSFNPAVSGPFWKRLDFVVEKQLVRSASAFTTISPTLAEVLGNLHGKPVYVVFNGWDEQCPIAKASSLEFADPVPWAGPYLYYAGRLYPHQMQSVRLLFSVLTNFPGISFVFQFLGPKELEKQTQEWIVSMNLAQRVFIMPPAAPDIVLQRDQEALANVVFEDLATTDVFSKGTLTGKLMELLSTAPPILCVARSDSDILQILTSTGKGQLCSDQDEIKAFLGDISINTKRWKGDPIAVEEFSRESQTGRICEVLDSVAGLGVEEQ